MYSPERKIDRELIDLKDTCSDRKGAVIEARVEEYALRIRAYEIKGHREVASKHERVAGVLFSRLERQNHKRN